MENLVSTEYVPVLPTVSKRVSISAPCLITVVLTMQNPVSNQSYSVVLSTDYLQTGPGWWGYNRSRGRGVDLATGPGSGHHRNLRYGTYSTVPQPPPYITVRSDGNSAEKKKKREATYHKGYPCVGIP